MKKPIPFGKYVLLDRINVGGMAEVFKAKAFGVEGFERLVAVKRILPSIAEDQEFITMFIDEAKISVQLTHANVAQTFDLGKVTDAYFIAMEYVHGKDLRAVFERARKRGETVPVPMACYLAMKMCEGLDYAHNKKDAAGRELHLVHRDVSPQNVLLSYDGETKIIDFGIAKAAGKASKTQAGILKGKFGYMSPEQVRGLPLDRRSDVFAVGIVLYELLTGERLFSGESDFSTLEKVRNVEIMPPSTYNRRIPDELEQLVLKALAKDVEDRYQSAMDLHDDLQSFMYTSGNFFSRKDLSAYMRKAFADEIAKETAREEEYRRMEADGSLSSSPGVVTSGLDAFDDLAPVERSQPAAQVPSRPAPPVPTQKPPARKAATMMGMPAAVPPPPVPPPPPARVSAPVPPPPRPSSASVPTSSTAAPPAAAPASTAPAVPTPPVAEAAAGGIDMDWDEEELSTQIYDKPDDVRSPLVADLPPAPVVIANPMSSPGGVSSPGVAAAPLGVSAAPPFASTPIRSASPSEASGAPSPFDNLPAQGSIVAEPTAVTHKAPAPKAASSSGLIAAVVTLVAVAGVAAVGAGAWFMLARSQPATITLSTVPADPVVYLDGTVVQTSTSSPFVVANVTPGQHTVEVRKEGFGSWATTVTIESGAQMQLPQVTLVPAIGAAPASNGGPVAAAGLGAVPASAGTGFALTSSPEGAEVFVNERSVGRTPVRVADLAAGTYQVRVERGVNYTPWVTQITVASGQVVSLPSATLTLRSATVEFTSDPPGALVTVVRGAERRSIGRTPVSADLDVSGGAWMVQMSKDGFVDQNGPLMLQVGQDRGVHAVTLARSNGGAVERPVAAPRTVIASRPSASAGEGSAPAVRIPPPRPSGGPAGPTVAASEAPRAAAGGNGTLRINTRPWSQVFVDGNLIGNTPQMSIPLSAGRHQVTLVNAEFNIRQSITVEIRAGQTETRLVTLETGG